MRRAFKTVAAVALFAAGCSRPANLDGNAVLRTKGGDARTCAGYKAYLIPDNSATQSTMRKIFGSTDKGYADSDKINDLDTAGANVIEKTCDSQGNFAFSNMDPGAYFVVTTVIWEVPQEYGSSSQGGTLMQHINLASGDKQNIVLTE